MQLPLHQAGLESALRDGRSERESRVMVADVFDRVTALFHSVRHGRSEDILLGYLRDALGHSGCPVCRLRAETVDRQIFYLMWEDISNARSRADLVASLGLCHEHTWYVQEGEHTHFDKGLRTAIIYEEVVRAVSQALRTGYWSEIRPAVRLPWWQKLLRGLGLYEPPSPPPGSDSICALPASLQPRTECPACQAGRQTEEAYILCILRHWFDDNFQDAYRAGDGLCLPHLRQALLLAARDDPEAVRFLAEHSIQRLEHLDTDLCEFIRKQNWESRGERMTSAEIESCARAAAFLTGEEIR